MKKLEDLVLGKMSLLGNISIILMLLLSQSMFGQKFQHSVSFPAATYVQTNIAEVGAYYSGKYVNANNIPHFGYQLMYDKYIVGVEHFSSYRFVGTEVNNGNMEALNIDSYSMLFGYQLLERDRLKLKGGLGVNYNPAYIGFYVDIVGPGGFDSRYCYEDNKYGPLFWSALEYSLINSFYAALNLRYNPMFSGFDANHSGRSACVSAHNNDRLNYLLVQCSFGYSF